MAGQDAWNEERALQLIEAYRIREVLWNPENRNFYKKHIKQDAWSEIAKLMAMTEEKCNNKIVSLLSSYRREKLRVKKSIRTGKGKYTSRWFAYDTLKFLDNRNTARKRKNTESPNWSNTETNDDQIVESESALNEETPMPAKQTKRDDSHNSELSDVRSILQFTTTQIDSSADIPNLNKSFASFIEAKMNTYTSQTRTSVEHAIFEIIMKADRGYYDVSWHKQEEYQYSPH